MAGSGRPKTGGRKRGTPNKTTASIKDAILRAFEKVGAEDYLVTVARDDPRTFCGLLGRVLPSEIKARVDGALTHEEALAELEGRLREHDARGEAEAARSKNALSAGLPAGTVRSSALGA